MQIKSIVALFVATVGINAAPSADRRATSVPITIYEGTGCNTNPVPITVANVPTDGTCFGISPIVSGPDSYRVESSQYVIRPGCNITVYNTPDCSFFAQHNQITQSGQCGTFGNSLIRGAIASGSTC
ncbi:hypothetical protein K458DRAFT_390712 [Lentithecium fluviatile CBS 122367]|uniref:Uncharacterized protein n=1 Tax=Lentithecium fluviatile CBS 122367 TaxID=1168545 RepID=A0A6G1IXE7_9PLEO|nr:hypothetical protein K458DRAFT_390712 [Lentithecium fluviatile CBS 122367]